MHILAFFFATSYCESKIYSVDNGIIGATRPVSGNIQNIYLVGSKSPLGMDTKMSKVLQGGWRGRNVIQRADE